MGSGSVPASYVDNINFAAITGIQIVNKLQENRLWWRSVNKG